jgi:hypothetical protein
MGAFPALGGRGLGEVVRSASGRRGGGDPGQALGEQSGRDQRHGEIPQRRGGAVGQGGAGRRGGPARDELGTGAAPFVAGEVVGLILDGILRADGGVDPGLLLPGRPR